METFVVLGALAYVRFAAFCAYAAGADEGPKTGWTAFAILMAIPFVLFWAVTWHPH